jgi:hypothetical protein
VVAFAFVDLNYEYMNMNDLSNMIFVRSRTDRGTMANEV